MAPPGRAKRGLHSTQARQRPDMSEIKSGDVVRIHYTGRPGDFRDQLIGRSGRSSILGQLQTGGVIGEYQLAGRGKKATFVIEVL